MLEKDVPVVSVLDPCADREVHRTVGQRSDPHHRGGIGQDARIGGQHRKDGLAGHIHVVAVGDAHGPVHAARLGGGIVVDDGRRDRVVGNVDRLVVGRGDHRREELDVAHGSRLSLRRDVVADAVGFPQQDHHPAGKVLGRAAQSHTDGQRGGRRDGDERCHVDAQRRHDDQDEQQREERADGITRERTQRNVDIAVLHGHVDQPQEAAHEPASDEIDG